ncbi:MAG TPA: hypothetical protein VK934_07750, partial [Fimbriimonas sp.]|nr:hypothetical protein [Fimbriimonas sp.]
TSAEVEVAAKNDAYAVGRRGETYVERAIESKVITAPIKQGDIVADLVLKDKDGFEQRVPLIAQESIGMNPVAAVKHTAGANGVAVAAGSLMFLGAYAVRSRRQPYGKKKPA